MNRQTMGVSWNLKVGRKIYLFVDGGLLNMMIISIAAYSDTQLELEVALKGEEWLSWSREGDGASVKQAYYS